MILSRFYSYEHYIYMCVCVCVCVCVCDCSGVCMFVCMYVVRVGGMESDGIGYIISNKLLYFCL